MATTTNYGWTTPDDTALVKDGASAIRTLGTSVDTTTKNLNPSTTLGDIEYRSSTANTNTRLGIGSTGNVLTVAGGVPSWAAPAGGGASWTLINSGGTALTGAQTVTVSGISGYNQLAVYLGKASSASNNSSIGIRFNGITTSATYGWFGFHNDISAAYSPTSNGVGYDGGSNGYWWLGLASTAAKDVSGGLMISGTNTSAIKMVESVGSGSNASGTSQQVWLKGYVDITAAITSVSCFSSVGNLDGGTMYIYGSVN